MSKLDLIAYLKTLKPEDWVKKVTNRWTVKDVVAHMVGWEKEDASIIASIWQTKEQPWFFVTDNYDDFNKRSVEYYKTYTPAKLIQEWERLQTKVQEEIDKIGEEKLRTRSDLFKWLFDEGNISHYNEHLTQIKQILN